MSEQSDSISNELAPMFFLDADLIAGRAFECDLALFASRSLNFCWLPRDHCEPVALDHPDEPGAVFYPLGLLFLAWVRGRTGRLEGRGRVLTLRQRRAVDRVWSYACGTYHITDDDRSKLPEPCDELPQ